MILENMKGDKRKKAIKGISSLPLFENRASAGDEQ